MGNGGSIMITGGAGYLGSYLVRHLLREKGEKNLVLYDMYPNFRIRGIDRLEDIRDQVTIVQGDVSDTVEVFSVIKRHKVERVVHLAFNTGAWAGGNPSRWMRVNNIGFINVCEAALHAGVKRMVYASSARVYGSEIATMRNDPLTEEETPPTPTVGPWENVYGACKLMHEMLAHVYWEKYGLDVICMRPTGTFGLGKSRDASDAPDYSGEPVSPSASGAPELEVVARLEMAALGEPVMLPPDEQYLDWMFAADAAEAWYLALTVEDPPHRVYNMNSETRPMGEITAYMRRLVPDAKITISPEPLERLPLMSNERLRKELGFNPRYTVEEGLRETLSAARVAAGLPPLAPV